jgi:MSHA biogenesis protein MshP
VRRRTERRGFRPPVVQKGFALVAGIFLITILFLLSAYMVGVRVRQDSAFVLDALSTRAYAAARAGVEWGAYKSLIDGTCAASTTVSFSGTLAGFVATVACSRSAFNEAGATINVDTIVANACNQPSAGSCFSSSPGVNYAERQLTLMVAQ